MSSPMAGLPDQKFNSSISDLVERSELIILAKVSGIENLAGGHIRYYFSTQETLKGKNLVKFHIDFNFGVQMDADFNSHGDFSFWDYDVTRVSKRTHLSVAPDFNEESSYLLFLPEPYHARSFEKITDSNDLWLSYIRSIIADRDHGITLAQYLTYQYGVSIVETFSCVNKKIFENKIEEVYAREVELLYGCSNVVDRIYPRVSSNWTGCKVGDRYLMINYQIPDEASPRFSKFSVYPIDDNGRVDFSEIKTSIRILGPRFLNLDDIRRLFKNQERNK